MTALTMFRGRSMTITESLTNLGSSGISGFKFWFTAKNDYADADAAAAIQKLPAAWAQDTAGDATHPGVAHCNLAPADTASLPPYQIVLVFDVQAEDALGNFFTVDSGTLTVMPSVTTVTS
jgi:hypothetical protein